MSIVLGPNPPDIGIFPDRPALRPRDLPGMREDQRRYGENFMNAAIEYHLCKSSGTIDDLAAGQVWKKAARCSEEGRLFFVQREMTPAVTARAVKVPENVPIMAVRRPADSGMVVFEKPPALWSHDAEGRTLSTIDAISWVAPEPGIGLLTASWLRLMGSAMDSQKMVRLVGGPLPPWIMTGIVEIPIDSIGLLQMSQILTAIWTLMKEPRTVETRTVQRHGKKARAAERYHGGNPPVTVVNVRPGVYGRPADPGSREGKPLQHLVDVEGHYKTYHVGRGRREKVVRWVSPHTRGPEGAPRSTRETVRVLRPEKERNKK